MSEELKPCPSCSGKSEFLHYYNEIRCGECPMRFMNQYISKEQLLNIWNSLPRNEDISKPDDNSMFKKPIEMIDYLIENEGVVLHDAYGRKWVYQSLSFYFADIGDLKYSEGMQGLHLYGTIQPPKDK